MSCYCGVVSSDPSELPLCEISLACDNLLCDGHGRPPNPVLVVHVYIPADGVWIKYAKTEVVEVSLLLYILKFMMFVTVFTRVIFSLA